MHRLLASSAYLCNRFFTLEQRWETVFNHTSASLKSRYLSVSGWLFGFGNSNFDPQNGQNRISVKTKQPPQHPFTFQVSPSSSGSIALCLDAYTKVPSDAACTFADSSANFSQQNFISPPVLKPAT
jgi:hypothetical protein